MNDITKYFLDKNYKKESSVCTYFARLFMILIKKYKVRLFIILTHFKDGNWYTKSHSLMNDTGKIFFR